MLDLRADLLRAVRTTEPVLVVGEPGSGRARVARTLHYSGSATGALVQVACGARAPERAEAELFGWVRGAFPGATDDRPGLVQRAHDGTIVLEDVERLEPALRARLNEVLREGTVKRAGATKPERVDTRWVATSSATGRERAELLDELAAVELRLPPLREREVDIELLAQHFVALLGAPRALQGLTEGALW
jgi:DNA-binding NtrC family response regulator